MFINKDSIVIDNVSMGQYLLEAKYGYHKLWGKDSGRNLAGTQSGTLLGVFPKLTLQFRKLTKAEVEILAPILDKAYQSVSYYDPNKKAQVTMATYSGDWELVSKRLINGSGKCEAFSCAFISVSRRA